jgi:hypothetical protein
VRAAGSHLVASMMRDLHTDLDTDVHKDKHIDMQKDLQAATTQANNLSEVSYMHACIYSWSTVFVSY